MTAIQVLGWLGNAAFFSRSFVQWWQSERERRSVAPTLFWRLSLLGSITLGAYAFSRHTHVLLAGYVLNGLIYARNIWFQRGKARPLPGRVATLLALAAAAALAAGAIYELQHRDDPSLTWVLVACLGQALWSSRFVLQWWASERAAYSHFPRLFWWLSLAGNALLLAYALHLGDLVFIAGFAPGPLVQVRNLMLTRGGANEPHQARQDG